MGYLAARDMADHVDLRTGVAWHLSTNMYPPVHPVFLDVALEAINAGVEAYMTGDMDSTLERVVTMPNGIRKTLRAIGDELRLFAFIEAEVDRLDRLEEDL